MIETTIRIIAGGLQERNNKETQELILYINENVLLSGLRSYD